MSWQGYSNIVVRVAQNAQQLLLAAVVHVIHPAVIVMDHLAVISSSSTLET